MMVDQCCYPAAGRFHRSHKGAYTDHFCVQGLVQPPPQLLQDLRERLWRITGKRHPAGEAAVKMCVRVHKPGNCKLALAIDPLSIRWYLVTFAFVRTQDRLNLPAIDNDRSLIVQSIRPIPDSYTFDQPFHQASSSQLFDGHYSQSTVS